MRAPLKTPAPSNAVSEPVRRLRDGVAKRLGGLLRAVPVEHLAKSVPAALAFLVLTGIAGGSLLYGIDVAFYAALLMVPVILSILLVLVVTE